MANLYFRTTLSVKGFTYTEVVISLLLISISVLIFNDSGWKQTNQFYQTYQDYKSLHLLEELAARLQLQTNKSLFINALVTDSATTTKCLSLASHHCYQHLCTEQDLVLLEVQELGCIANNANLYMTASWLILNTSFEIELSKKSCSLGSNCEPIRHQFLLAD